MTFSILNPYPENYFNASLSIHGLQYGMKTQREKAFAELERTLQQNGLLFVAVLSKSHPLYGQGLPIPGDPDSFREIPDLHVGFRHFFDDIELLQVLSCHFDIISLEEHYSEPLQQGNFFKHGLYEWRVLAQKKKTP
ncbi:hypothetical protein HYX14_02480 [Candidatus Woesearchaeota archaeon]|nr:hypothetical protein [Candidatus Woesearchaeota archaeon]